MNDTGWNPWRPQRGPQLEAIQARAIPELFFGGARGGGKSDFLLGDYLQDVSQGEPWKGIIFRRTFPELEELISRSEIMVPQTWPGAEWWKSEKTWKFPSGATLRMRSLERAEDVSHFWGHAYSWIGWDELGAFPDDKPYRQLMACLRSAQPIECKRIRATGNPGGPGHGWIRARFVDPAPQGYRPIVDSDTGTMRVFIPSRVEDNAILMKRDPEYVNRLRAVGSPELVKAWLSGDWNAIVGSFFPEFGSQHIIRPFRPPGEWLRGLAMDWGSARPFCVLWFAVADGSEHWLPRGALYVYNEWYGAASPNVGLRLTVEQVAQGIRERSIGDEPPRVAVLDPACFATDGGPSIAERLGQGGCRFRPADNKRVGKLGASAGWDLLRQRLVGEDGQPMLYVSSTCTNLIRTLPLLQHDKVRPEDAATDGEDHAADALRYAVASRPWIAPGREPEERLSLDFLWREKEKQVMRW